MTIQGNWTPDIAKIASELITGYRYGETKEDGNETAMRVMTTWQHLARDRDYAFTDADWLVLVQELAQRCAESC